MNEIEIYKTSENNIEIRVQFQGDTVWLTHKLMAELYDKDADTISLHLKNIDADGELKDYSTTELFSVVQKQSHCFNKK